MHLSFAPPPRLLLCRYPKHPPPLFLTSSRTPPPAAPLFLSPPLSIPRFPCSTCPECYDPCYNTFPGHRKWNPSDTSLRLHRQQNPNIDRKWSTHESASPQVRHSDEPYTVWVEYKSPHRTTTRRNDVLDFDSPHLEVSVCEFVF